MRCTTSTSARSPTCAKSSCVFRPRPRRPRPPPPTTRISALEGRRRNGRCAHARRHTRAQPQTLMPIRAFACQLSRLGWADQRRARRGLPGRCVCAHRRCRAALLRRGRAQRARTCELATYARAHSCARARACCVHVVNVRAPTHRAGRYIRDASADASAHAAAASHRSLSNSFAPQRSECRLRPQHSAALCCSPRHRPTYRAGRAVAVGRRVRLQRAVAARGHHTRGDAAARPQHGVLFGRDGRYGSLAHTLAHCRNGPADGCARARSRTAARARA